MSSVGKLALLIGIAVQLYCTYAQYQIAPYSSNWFEASEYCSRRGMRLAIVDTAAKHEAVVAEAKAANLYGSGYFGVWLGATDLARSNIFIWHSTGQRMRFSRWKQGEPTGGNEHCVCLYYWPEQGFNWTWNDAHCDTSLYAICEMTSCT